MADKVVYGPAAALSRSQLNEEQQELFDWFTSKITDEPKEAVFYSSLLQSAACKHPSIGYWDAVKLLKMIATPQLIATLKGPAFEQAKANLSKSPD